MHRDANVIGQNVAKFRFLRTLTQDELVVKMQMLGCNITRDILANIETQRSPVTDKQIEYFVEVLGIELWDLFPPNRHFSGQKLGLAAEIVTRHRHFQPRPCPNETRDKVDARLAHALKS
jgi:transcriptional regulator with XRE-family HTH domain